MRTVAVVGAGPSGLCAARHLAQLAANPGGPLHFRVFEATTSLGGTWNFSEEVTWETAGGEVRTAHTSIYRDLRTDIPREAMQFPDFPMEAPSEGDPSYMHHTEVHEYLEHYATQYQLHQYIEFNKEVRSIAPIQREEVDCQWHVSVADLKTGTIEDCTFDAIMICNGHFSEGNIPSIPGLESFKKCQAPLVMHSRSYRRPEAFAGRRVALWGAGPSAWDIALEVARVAKSVTICHRPTPWLPSGFPPDIKLSGNIVSAREEGLELDDGTFYECDALIYCTGYCYSFPFLTQECGIKVENNCVVPLYKQLINAEHPSMCFVGIPQATLPFPMAHFQVQYFLGMLHGSVVLPSRAIMRAEGDSCISHRLAEHLWDYLDDLANSTAAVALPAYPRAVTADSITTMMQDIANFKKYRYVPTTNGSFVKVQAQQ
ncbi:flavin-containing monooxygenase FMO GS-OX-like 4 [Ischnura elegans]|uniref:flavin-containing monooxygenase FMO GS-OX-like 4 n=1 Tax=Ischnura elegans TaxID=197161 RepID=UPI001ED87A5A|nr:flavin-containing monooxygenase FMO GS-OX-like 4 [Ischnura elegans]